jgi:hypothetical protein
MRWEWYPNKSETKWERILYDLVLENNPQTHKWFHNHLPFEGHKRRGFWSLKRGLERRKKPWKKTLKENQISNRLLNIIKHQITQLKQTSILLLALKETWTYMQKKIIKTWSNKIKNIINKTWMNGLKIKI